MKPIDLIKREQERLIRNQDHTREEVEELKSQLKNAEESLRIIDSDLSETNEFLSKYEHCQR